MKRPWPRRSYSLSMKCKKPKNVTMLSRNPSSIFPKSSDPFQTPKTASITSNLASFHKKSSLQISASTSHILKSPTPFKIPNLKTSLKPTNKLYNKNIAKKRDWWKRLHLKLAQTKFTKIKPRPNKSSTKNKNWSRKGSATKDLTHV